MKKRLRDIADIRTGYQFRGKVAPEPGGAVKVIQIKDITDQRRIRTDDLVTVKLDRPDQYVTQAGDVLFLSRGHRLFAAAVTEAPPVTIATGYFFIVRPKEENVLGPYLAWYLNQPAFQESLRPLIRGSHMPLVAKGDFQDVEITLPPLDVQHGIVCLNDLMDDERRLVDRLQEKRAELLRALAQRGSQ
jgi:restriction endonuclease S subunit